MTADGTCYIIEKDNKYLQAVNMYPYQYKPIWTPYKYDAVMIRDRQYAWRTAKKMKATLMVFNQLTGRTEEWTGW